VSEYDQDLAQGSPEKLSLLQRAWCVLMLGVILASVAVLGVFLDNKLHPKDGPALRFELDDLIPRPGFDL
jgi:hypothetical protein